MAHLDADELERFLALLRSEDFMVFVQEHQHAYQYRDDFAREKMPNGLDPAFMWEFVSFVRRMAGRPLVSESSANGFRPPTRQSFWTATPAMIAGLNDVVSRCNDASKLSSSLFRLEARPAIRQLVIEELDAAAFRDGIHVEREALRELLCDERQPETAEEQVISNAIALMDDIGDHTSKPMDAKELRHLNTQLQAGIGLIEPRPYHPPTPCMPPELLRGRGKTLEDVARSWEHPCSWGPHPLFDVLLNADMIWVDPPFERFAGLTEVLIRWHSYCTVGVPALRFVPLSRMRLDWERRLVGPPEAPMRFGEAIVESGFGVDSTPYIQQIIRFLNAGLDRVERIVSRIDEADDRCRRLIDQDGRLTLRQKQLLDDLVDDPTRAVDVASYEKRFDVATSTARGDLVRLVSLNLLSTEFQGKKQLFRLRPDAPRIISEAAERRG